LNHLDNLLEDVGEAPLPFRSLLFSLVFKWEHAT
jgi:hypothetical protein